MTKTVLRWFGIAALAFCIFAAGQVFAATVTGTGNTAILTWDAPTTNTDGTPYTDGAGYKIYCGKVSGSYTMIIDTHGLVNTWTVTFTSDGMWYCVVTAYDVSGIESGYSNEVSKLINNVGPSAPHLNAPSGGSYL